MKGTFNSPIIKRGRVPPVERVNVTLSLVHQEPYHCHVTTAYRQMECSPSVVVRHVEIYSRLLKVGLDLIEEYTYSWFLS